MPSFKRSHEILMPEAVTPLPKIENLTPVRDNLPQHMEKLINKSNVVTTSKVSSFCETPKMKNKASNVARLKLRRRILSEETTNISTILEARKIESPKRDATDLKTPRADVVDLQDKAMVNQPVSLKSRRQIYMKSRFNERRQQRKEFELKRRTMSHDQMLCHFRDIIMDDLLTSQF